MARYVRPCEGQMWQVASLTRYKNDIEADKQTDFITIDLQVVCSKKSLQVEQCSLRTGAITVRLVNGKRVAY